MKPRPALLRVLFAILFLIGAWSGLTPVAQGDGEALVHRSYPVGALLGGRLPPRVPILGLGLRGQSFLHHAAGMAEEEDEEPVARSFAPDEIIDLLPALVPGLGDIEGEVLELDAGRLLVATTPARHEKVAAALAAFWAEAATRIEVVLQRVRIPTDAAKALDTSTLALLRSGDVPSAQREASSMDLSFLE